MKASVAFPGFCLTLHLMAGSAWPTIPPEVWALKEGPKGAVVLEDRMRFTWLVTERTYRVRIFAEAGRSAAEIPDLPSSVTEVKGRTVYPDGRQVEFNSRKDFAERRVETGDRTHTQTHLVAPGVTADCVVEFFWSESANGLFRGLPDRYSRGLYGTWTLANPFPTQVLSVEVRRPYPLAWSLHPGTALKPEVTSSGDSKQLVFKNLPATDYPPYSLGPALGLPRLVIFWQPDLLAKSVRDGDEEFWSLAIVNFYKPDYEDGIDKGSEFKALAKTLTADLPKEPVAAAVALLERLDGRITNLSQATHEEAALLPKSFWKGFKAKDLAAASQTGKTNGQGMRLLYYHLLKAAGLKPVLAKVPNRQVALFAWRDLNPWQFDADLIGIEGAAGGMMWFDPSLRHATPGVVHPDFTGVPALLIDTATWKGRQGSVGSLPATVNFRRYTYQLDLGEDADRFTVESSFAGYPEFIERGAYRTLEPKEQSKLLKESFEKAMKNLTVTEAEVRNTADAKTSVTWTLKGSLERESSRRRVLDPFPGMPWPLWVPSKLDETRTTAIVLPYLSTQLAVATFKPPKGYAMGAHQELRHENAFGRVFWVPSFDAATGTGKVVLRVEVATLSAPAGKWSEFRQFLTWIEEACRRQVVLTREG